MPCPCFTEEIKETIKERDRAYNRFLMLKEMGTYQETYWEQYKNVEIILLIVREKQRDNIMKVVSRDQTKNQRNYGIT